jgi:hypothetical protein
LFVDRRSFVVKRGQFDGRVSFDVPVLLQQPGAAGPSAA